MSKKEKNKVLDFISENYLYFMMYAIIGWIYEVVLEVFIYKWGFSNRGVLFGPWCPVYGFGALIFIFVAYRFIKDKPLKTKLLMIPVVFLFCMISATLLELLTSYLCEFVLGYWPWQTYATSYPNFNFQGRIALSPSLRFGLGGTIFLYLLQPVFEKLLKKLGDKKYYVAFFVLGLLTMDIIIKILG